MISDFDYTALAKRVGPYLFRQRMRLQEYYVAQSFGPGRTYFHPENARWARKFLTVLLKTSGLYWLGERHAHAIRLHEHRAALPQLPAAFNGYRVLHLSDLHLDLDEKLARTILERVREARADICVITGDYCSFTMGDPEIAMGWMRELLRHLAMPVYAVLGNHDRIEMVTHLEAMGVRMLMNEHVALAREDACLYLAGVDDPHYFETSNLEKAVEGIPEHAPVILLAHTAEIYREALGAGIALFLCGHTHAGQMSLPGGTAILHNARHPRRMNSGPWRFHELQGYTSSGTGACIVPVRFFAPGEIVVHVLEAAPDPASPA